MQLNHWNLVGHEWAVASLARDIESDRLRHAYLIAGPDSIGKRTLAHAFARALLCERSAGDGRPCPPGDECRACRLALHGNHPDLAAVAPAVSGRVIRTEKINIDRIRELIKLLALKPSQAARRIALITNFETAGDEAANAFLKTLEEPPGDAVVILTADSLEALLPTIVSRCEVIALRPLPTAVVRRALVERWQLPGERAELLARLSGGRLGWAATADEQTLEQRAERLSALTRLLSASRVERFAYADMLWHDRDAMRDTLELWLSWWRDVILVASNASTAPLNSDQLEALSRAAEAVGPESAARAVDSIQRLLALLPRNVNARLALEVLMLELPHI